MIIMNHADTRLILPKFEGSCMVYRLKWYRGKIILKSAYHTGIEKM